MSHKQYFKKLDPLIAFPPETYCPANNYYDILDADAVEADVLIGKTFYADSIPKKTGTMPNIGDCSDVIELVAEEIEIPLGYHNGDGIVKISVTEQAKIIPANIKKDVVILGVTGTLETSPAVICPVNGYIPDPAFYEIPVPVPESTEQSVILVCNASLGNLNANTAQWKIVSSTGANLTYNVYDSGGSLIDTYTSNAQLMTYTFPASTGYYTIKISATSPNTITSLSTASSSMIWDSCIESIILNTPNMTGFDAGYNKNLKTCTFNNGSFENLTAYDAMFQNCLSFLSFTFPDGTLNGTRFDAMFAGSGIYKIDMSGVTFSDTKQVGGVFQNCRNLEEVIYPATLKGYQFASSLRQTPRLKKCTLPTTIVQNGATFDGYLYFMFYLSSVEGEVIFPEFPSAASISLQCLFYLAPYVEIVRLKGAMLNVSNTSQIFAGALMLHTFEAPRNVGASAYNNGWTGMWDGSNTSMKYLIAPDIGYIPYPTNAGLISITGEQDTSGFSTHPAMVVPYQAKTTFTTFNCAKLRVQSLQAGPNSSNILTLLTTIEIDWANSSWASATAPQLMLRASLDATELNRIMTALPSVAKTMDIGDCTGYATADHTIATAKGWTVRGWVKNVVTDAATNIARTTVTLSGSYGYNGGYTPSAVGVCYAQTANPTTSSAKVTSADANPFSFNATGLTANKLYYARAYVITTYGTTYGPQITFTTLP